MSGEPVWIVLAAGASLRLGQPKAIVDLGGGLRPLDSLLAVGAASLKERAVVFGAHTHALPAGVRAIDHPDWASGRTGSVQAAVRGYPGRDLLLAPVDVPLIPSSVVRALLEIWQAALRPERGWLAPRHRASARYGHPVLLGRALASEILSSPPDRALSEHRARAEPLLACVTDSCAVLEDLDTPEDLERLRLRRGFAALQSL
jgi:molybdenum cofactor cytidylyltransferase